MSNANSGDSKSNTPMSRKGGSKSGTSMSSHGGGSNSGTPFGAPTQGGGSKMFSQQGGSKSGTPMSSQGGDSKSVTPMSTQNGGSNLVIPLASQGGGSMSASPMSTSESDVSMASVSTPLQEEFEEVGKGLNRNLDRSNRKPENISSKNTTVPEGQEGPERQNLELRGGSGPLMGTGQYCNSRA